MKTPDSCRAAILGVADLQVVMECGTAPGLMVLRSGKCNTDLVRVLKTEKASRSPFWMQKLSHAFGDNGIFWMTYDDLLEHFTTIERTKLFDQEWHVIQEWTSINVTWVDGYSKTKFIIDVKQAGIFVIALSQVRIW